jgi:uncharacterized protein (TIGR02594 family)
MISSPYALAERFVGTAEVSGHVDNPQVMAWLTADAAWPQNDEVPWCSGFVNWVCKIFRAPRSKSLRARSWLGVGTPVPLNEARRGFDVAIFKRGGGDQPGPEVLDAPGHVAFFSAYEQGASGLYVLGGNQSNKVSVAPYLIDRLLGIRRLGEI